MRTTISPTFGLCLALGVLSVSACATGPQSGSPTTAHQGAARVDGGRSGDDASAGGPSSPPVGVDATSAGTDAGSANDTSSSDDASSVGDVGASSLVDSGSSGADVVLPSVDAAPDAALLDSAAPFEASALEACAPTTCQALQATCGVANDGCGGSLSCGTCMGGQICGSSNTCVVADPFDPTSCSGAPLTLAQAAQLFQSGATQSIIGGYTIEMRQRSCTAVTGCGAWGTPTTSIAATLGQTGLNRALSGQIVLDVQSSSIALSLVDSTEELPSMMGATCGAVAGMAEQCSGYEYDLGDQWGGSGGLFPTLEPLIDANGNNVVFTGALTDACLRLSYSAMDTNGNDVQDYVIFAPVEPGNPPPTNPCPGGGVPMGCDGQSGTGACCQEGTQTCPGAGCDCWSACD